MIWIVLDSVGAGESPDAEQFGDRGADTLGHIIEKCPDIGIPNLKRLGLGKITGVSWSGRQFDGDTTVIGCYGKARELSNGKDTTTGHWEMIGIHTQNPFPTYPDGFPDEVIDAFIRESGCGQIYGNKTASGVPIIAEYGERHMETGYPIIYTSADSVFQIAASEERVGLGRLYDMCRIARNILQGEHGVGRVIARPFIRREDGSFERTANRRDYALMPDSDNILVHLKDRGVHVRAVGKISDIFNGVGITESVHTTGNADGMAKTETYLKVKPALDDDAPELIFTNLVDFDMKYGHRRDVEGYRLALEAFDTWLGGLLENLSEEDILVINADHGCDPTYKGTDHTREYVPVLLYGRALRQDVELGVLESFGDIGKTVEEYLLGGTVEDSHTTGASFLRRCLP